MSFCQFCMVCGSQDNLVEWEFIPGNPLSLCLCQQHYNEYYQLFQVYPTCIEMLNCFEIWDEFFANQIKYEVEAGCWFSDHSDTGQRCFNCGGPPPDDDEKNQWQDFFTRAMCGEPMDGCGNMVGGLLNADRFPDQNTLIQHIYESRQDVTDGGPLLLTTS